MPEHNMWDAIVAVALLLGQVFIYLQTRRTSEKVDLVETKVDANAAEAKSDNAVVVDRVDKTHDLVNSGLTKLIDAKDELTAAARKLGLLEGHAAGVAAEKQRVADEESGSIQDQTDAAAQAHNAEREKKKE